MDHPAVREKETGRTGFEQANARSETEESR